jgi:hypothetical protein
MLNVQLASLLQHLDFIQPDGGRRVPEAEAAYRRVLFAFLKLWSAQTFPAWPSHYYSISGSSQRALHDKQEGHREGAGRQGEGGGVRQPGRAADQRPRAPGGCAARHGAVHRAGAGHQHDRLAPAGRQGLPLALPGLP